MYNESLQRVKDTQARFELEAARYRMAEEVTNNSNTKSNKSKGKRAWIVSLFIAVGLVVAILLSLSLSACGDSFTLALATEINKQDTRANNYNLIFPQELNISSEQNQNSETPVVPIVTTDNFESPVFGGGSAGHSYKIAS